MGMGAPIARGVHQAKVELVAAGKSGYIHHGICLGVGRSSVRIWENMYSSTIYSVCYTRCIMISISVTRVTASLAAAAVP